MKRDRQRNWTPFTIEITFEIDILHNWRSSCWNFRRESLLISLLAQSLLSIRLINWQLLEFGDSVSSWIEFPFQNWKYIFKTSLNILILNTFLFLICFLPFWFSYSKYLEHWMEFFISLSSTYSYFFLLNINRAFELAINY